MDRQLELHRRRAAHPARRRFCGADARRLGARIPLISFFVAFIVAQFAGHAVVAAGVEPPHPILAISGSGSGAEAILSGWSESQYTNNFIPRQSPRNDSYGFVPAVVAGDTSWSWTAARPNEIVSLPSGKVFPGAAGYQSYTQAVTVLNGSTVLVPYYLRAGSATSKSLVYALIDYRKRGQLRSDLNKLAPAYINSGASHATRNQNYARRVGVALLDWARWFPNYYVTGKNTATLVNTGPGYILSADLQRASDHNGLAHEWADDELLAFDAIYDSPALAALSGELGFDVRGYIKTNLFCNEGDFIVYHVPVNVAIASNLSGPYTVLALVARVLDRPDYILWLDAYLDATVTRKIRRDGTLSEGMGYSIGYLNENLGAARNTRDYFLSRPADTPALQSIRVRSTNYAAILDYGRGRWSTVALPNGQLPSFGDTPFNTYFTARNAGSSAVLPAYGTVALGAGAGSQAVQLNQNFSGDNNHMRSDTCAFTLWAFGSEILGNIRYHNGTPGRQFTEQLLAHNAVTIDRADMSSPSANTYGNGDLTLYEPGTNGLAVTEVDGQRAYANKASRYQRVLLLNTFEIERPYLVDVFRVTGGRTHDYVLHGSIRYDQTWECSFALVTNAAAYPMLEGAETWVEPDSSGDSFPYYGFWRNVCSNRAPGNFQITYRDASASNRDVRLWMTDDGTAGVYVGRTPVPSRSNGEPADYWVNGLWRPSSIIRKRITSGSLENLFVSVVEPMKNGLPGIVDVQRLPVSGAGLESCALRITFSDGRVDTALVNLRNPQVNGATGGSASISTLDGQFALDGRVGVHTSGPRGLRAWAVDASRFAHPAGTLQAGPLRYAGAIGGETRRLAGAPFDALVTPVPLPEGTALRGRQLSLAFGTLSGTGGISELFEIDRVVLTNQLYHICLAADPMLEITNGNLTVEQVAPLRTFSGTNHFEIALSAVATNFAPEPSGPLVAHLNFDGGTAEDRSEYGNHGALVNGAAIVTDPQRGRVLSLDGTDDYVDLGAKASLNLDDDNEVTIAAWIKPTASKNHITIASKGEWKQAYSLLIKGDTTPPGLLWTGNDASVFSGAPIPLNAWTHVAVTLSGDLTTFYINGQVSGAASQDRGEVVDYSPAAVCIGREQYPGSLPGGRWFFPGQIDDFRLYRIALTQAEVQVLMASSPGGFPRFAGFDLQGASLRLEVENVPAGGPGWLLTTTNIVAPIPSWTPVATNYADANGRLEFVVPLETNIARKFFTIGIP